MDVVIDVAAGTVDVVPPSAADLARQRAEQAQADAARESASDVAREHHARIARARSADEVLDDIKALLLAAAPDQEEALR